MISVGANSIQQDSLPNLATIVNKIKEHKFTKVVIKLPKSVREPEELKNYGQELIRLVGRDVKITLSFAQDDTAILSEIVDMHTLDIDVEINSSFIGILRKIMI